MYGHKSFCKLLPSVNFIEELAFVRVYKIKKRIQSMVQCWADLIVNIHVKIPLDQYKIMTFQGKYLIIHILIFININ